MKLTFEFTFPCSQCQQLITDLDLAKNNYSLILLPAFSFQHLTCPKTKPASECQFNFIKDKY